MDGVVEQPVCVGEESYCTLFVSAIKANCNIYMVFFGGGWAPQRIILLIIIMRMANSFGFSIEKGEAR